MAALTLLFDDLGYFLNIILAKSGVYLVEDIEWCRFTFLQCHDDTKCKNSLLPTRKLFPSAKLFIFWKWDFDVETILKFYDSFDVFGNLFLSHVCLPVMNNPSKEVFKLNLKFFNQITHVPLTLLIIHIHQLFKFLLRSLEVLPSSQKNIKPLKQWWYFAKE